MPIRNGLGINCEGYDIHSAFGDRKIDIREWINEYIWFVFGAELK